MEKIISPQSISKYFEDSYKISEEDECMSLYYNNYRVCKNIKACKIFLSGRRKYKIFAIQNESNKWALIYNGIFLIHFLLKDVTYKPFVGQTLRYLKNVDHAPDGILILVTDNDKIGLFSMRKGLILFPQEKSISLYRYGFNAGNDVYNYDGQFQFNEKDGEYYAQNKTNFIFETFSKEYFLITDYDCGYNSYPSHRGGVFKLKKTTLSGKEVYVVDDYIYDGSDLTRGGEIIENRISEDDYCPYDDEDSWNAMTDGQYGDYQGTGWDFDF